MRVSPAFNAIAGPRLYHTLTLGETSGLANPFGGGTRGVFDIPVKKAWMKKSKDKQKTQGKERDLGLVRHIFFQGYFEPEQFPRHNKPADKGKLLHSVKTIRISIIQTPAYDKSKYFIEMLGRFTGLEKLVLTGTCCTLRLPPGGLTSTCNKVVTLVSQRFGNYPPQIHLAELEPCIGEFTYVFMDRDAHLGSKRADLCVDILVLDIAWILSKKAHHPKTVIIVNSPLIQNEGHAEETLQDYLIRLVELRKQNPDQLSNDNVLTTNQSAQYPTVKFVSMGLYLRDYDWAGEFTEEEVRPWLEDEEAERAAAQLEEEIIEGTTVE
jgi:hypothetical protein